MDEYIARGTAYETLTEYYHHTTQTMHDALREALDRVPTADVIPVVRCGECENWQSGWDSTSAPNGTHFCAVTGLFKPADWFCADGAKMGGTE